MLQFLVTVAMAASGFAFVAQDAPQTMPGAQDDAITVKGQQRARDKRVCKRAVATGSIMAKSTCKTAGEWEIERDRMLAQAERRRMAGMMDSENRRIDTDEPRLIPR